MSHSADQNSPTTARIELVALDGAYRFYLIRGDSEPLLVSGDYASRDRALADIDRLRHGSTRMEPCMTPSGRFYFGVVVEQTGRLAQSPNYERPSVRDDAMHVAARLLRSDLAVAVFT